MLEQIVIPASVTSIDKSAFRTISARGLKVLDIYCEVPPTLGGQNSTSAFNNEDTIYVRVPCGKTSVYQSAPGWSSYSNFVYEECVGVEDYEPADFKVWPNPANDVVNVECTTDNEQCQVKTVEMYDVYGKLVNTVNVTDSPIRVNVFALPAGMYVLRVKDADGREYQGKIVKR